MPRIQKLANLGPVGVLSSCCTINFRPHSSLGYQTPADYAGTIAATGSNAAQDESFAFPPVAHTAPLGIFKTAEAPIAVG